MVGDASETGLVKFCQNMFDLDEERKKYPIHSYYEDENKKIECLILFNSEHKFNLFIRDMNNKIKDPQSVDDNLMIVLKGAPERILRRCNKILIDGEEMPLTDAEREEIETSNNNFGS